MKIKIINCSKFYYWYNNKINHILNLQLIKNDDFVYKNDFYWFYPISILDTKDIITIMPYISNNNEFLLGILKTDCIILNRKEKLQRILNIDTIL